MTDKLNQDGTINENWIAEEITKREEGVQEVNVAQVKEVLRITLDILAEVRDELDALIEKHKK